MVGCKEHALAVGCNECLEKPVDRESFREAIIRGLERRGYWTVGMGLEQFGHVMEVVARTAAFGGSAKGKRPSLPKSLSHNVINAGSFSGLIVLQQQAPHRLPAASA